MRYAFGIGVSTIRISFPAEEIYGEWSYVSIEFLPQLMKCDVDFFSDIHNNQRNMAKPLPGSANPFFSMHNIH
jgi:hypothetical protein